MVAIENGPRPHHVRPGFRPRHDRRAVCQVHNTWIDPQRAQALDCRVKSLFLFPCLLPDGGFREYSRRSKMGKDARELQVLAFPELTRKALHVAGSDAQPVHSRIDFQMKWHALLSAVARSSTIEQLQLFAAM